MDYQFDAYISFSWKDQRRARSLSERLNQTGFVTWHAEKMIRGGESIPASLREGLQKSRFLLIVHSIHYATSRWALSELDAVRYDEVNGGENKVVFLIYENEN